MNLYDVAFDRAYIKYIPSFALNQKSECTGAGVRRKAGGSGLKVEGNNINQLKSSTTRMHGHNLVYVRVHTRLH